MDIKHIVLAMMAAGALLLTGCKDDEDTKPSLSGEVPTPSIPPYVLKGDTYHIVATGVYRGSNPADSLVGFYVFDPILSVNDTLRREKESGPAEMDYVVPDGDRTTYTLSVFAFAKGYYGKGSSVTFSLVNPSLDTLVGSLSGHHLGYEANTSFDDARDGQKYYVSSLSPGGWMLQNLAWEGAGVPFADAVAMNYVAGRFYTYEEALTACPAGWRLPSDADFVALTGAGAVGETIPGKAGLLKGDIWFNGEQLWEYQNSRILLTNEDYFSAMPWGYLTVSAGTHRFMCSGERAVFWTSDAVDAETALVRYLNLDSNDIFVQAMDRKSFGASVRCVKE